MKVGGEDLFRQLDRGMDYIQNSFNTAEGVVNNNVPTLLFKGIVIEVDFKTSKPTSEASITPPFSVYAKIIGLDDDTPNPEGDYDKIFYPPLFPMHNICIPEIGEEVLVLKESPLPSALGYYIGRVNDSSPLNISYARDYIGTNDPETGNNFRYGFSFDVRELRKKYETQMPSAEFNNISIPMTYGDVVQQGRTKTYIRHSFNRNNKKGVLEQGINLEGQLSSSNPTYNFLYHVAGDNSYKNPNDVEVEVGPPDPVGDEDDTQDEEASYDNQERIIYTNRNAQLGANELSKYSRDPSIGETTTKTIHFVDSAIKRIGNYSLESNFPNNPQNLLDDEDRGMIANIADEIYNISSKEIDGVLYRQVLGEKLVAQQRATFGLMRDVLNTVAGFAESTQLLLDAFIDHEHALPKIELNLEKTITVKDEYRTAPKYVPQPDQVIKIPGTPGRRINVVTGVVKGRALYGTEYIPGVPATTKNIPMPPKLVKKSQLKTRKKDHKINFEAIIGGKENPRFTAPIETESSSSLVNPLPGAPTRNVEKTDIGMKTEKINTNLQKVLDNFSDQQESLNRITTKINDFLSKNQFIN